MNIVKIYNFTIFFFFVCSIYPWFVWHNKLQVISSLLAMVMSLLMLATHKVKVITSSSKITIFWLLSSLVIWEAFRRNVFGVWLDHIALLIVLFVIIFSDLRFKQDILSRITKYFSILVSISLVSYILHLLGVNFLSSSYIEYADGRYPSLNYITFLAGIDIDTYGRFKAIFQEPGHMTMAIVPLLFANRFDLKNKYVLLLFIAELFSFSLAGYITMFIGFIFLHINDVKYLLSAAVLIIILIVVMKFTGNAELLERFLWSRLEFVDGTLAGDNRTTEGFDILFNSFIESDNRWIGLDVDYSRYGSNAGYKRYTVQYGFIGLILIIMLYVIPLINKRGIFPYVIVFLLLLFQNTYPLWCVYILTYIIGIEILADKSKCRK